jgi:YVTN family beta-propeller protein
MVVATVPVVIFPLAVAITPDRSHAYVVNNCSSNKVSVIATASNTVAATVTVGSSPTAIAITPDGKHAYVTNAGSNTVSVIATASNAVMATVAVGSFPYGVGIIPPPPQCVAFSAFSAKLAIALGPTPNQDAFGLLASFTLGSTSNG